MGEWEISSEGRYRRLGRDISRGEKRGRQGKHLGEEAKEAERERVWGNTQELKGVGERGVCYPMVMFADMPALASF